MKRLFPVLFVMFIVSAVPAFGYIQDATEADTGSCGNVDPDQACYAGTIGNIRCTDSFGCPQCGLDMRLKKSVCYRLGGMWGWCTCSPGPVGIDQFGQMYPKCARTGSCTVPRA